MYFIIVSFILGTILGSFFNVCIYRIPEKLSISNPPSHCYNCNKQLKPKDLIPILSWTILRGRCRYCGQKISSRYAIVELLTGILYTTVYIYFGYGFITIYYMFFVSLLIIITFIDLDQYIIPDEIIIIGSIVAFIVNMTPHGVEPKDGLIGAIVCGGGVLLVTCIIELLIKKEAMGGGDIKLFAMIGLFLGTRLGILTVFLSAYTGVFYAIITIICSKLKKTKYNSMIAYGPFISFTAIISVLHGTNIINWYWSIFL